MARYVVIAPVAIAASGYAQPARALVKGQVVELSSAEVTSIGAGNLRAVASSSGQAAGTRDQLGESYAAVERHPVGNSWYPRHSANLEWCFGSEAPLYSEPGRPVGALRNRPRKSTTQWAS